MLFDDVLKQHIGQFGHFQKILLAIMCLEENFVAYATLLPVFVAAIPDFWCSEPNTDISGCSADQQRALRSPTLSGGKYDQCHTYDVNYTAMAGLDGLCSNATGVASMLARNLSTAACQGWTYDTSVFHYTMTIEWDLVCSRTWLAATSSAVFMAGRATGNFIFGYLADRFGRRRIVLMGSVLTIASGLGCAASANIWMYLILRFAWANFATGKTNTIYVVVCEFTGPDWRTVACNIYFLFWAIGHMTLAGCAYLIPHWRVLTAVLVGPEIIFVFLFYFWVPESPRWLMTKDRHEEARAIMEQMAERNGNVLPDSEKVDITVEVQRDNMSLINLCKTPQIRLLTVALCYTWFTGSFVYYGLSLNTADLGGNPYLNFFLNGAVEVPGYLMCGFICKYLGRVLPMSFSLFMCGAVLLAMIPLPPDMVWASVTLAMTGKFFINIAVSIIWTSSSESYPTTMRNIGLAGTAVAGRVSSVLASYVGLLVVYSPILPMMIFGIMAVVASGVVLLVPETKGQPMPQTVMAGERFIKAQRVITLLWRRLKGRQLPSKDSSGKPEGQPLHTMA